MEIKLPLFLKYLKEYNARWIILLIIVSIFLCNYASAQDSNPYVSYNVPFQNLLKFNRFLINPTFSTIREDKSYVNLFHRSQSASFDNNVQNYFLSYSGRLNERIGLGVSLYNQQEGIISNLGVMANYSHAIQLGRESSLAFGVNIPYYTSNFDPDRAVAIDSDPLLDDATRTSIISFQPGMNLSLGKFDIGVFAQNLVDYNLNTGKSLTEFGQKTYSGHIQYAHHFDNRAGLLEGGRLLPLVRARFEANQDPVFGGGLIMDLPTLGWIQGGYDQFYGASAGAGFNLNRRLSFGYNFEKNISSDLTNLGVTHEVSIAYNFIPNLSNDVMIVADTKDEPKPIQGTFGPEKSDEPRKEKSKLEAKTVLRPTNKEDLAFWEEQIELLKAQQQENYAVINELIFKMDSMEQHRERDLEKRFEMVMRMVKRQTNDESPEIEAKAQQLYLAKNEDLDSVFDALDKSKKAVAETNTKSTKKEASHKGSFVGGDYKPIERFINLDGIGKGHYIVANVFKNEKYLKSFLAKLRKQGLDAKYFKNPDNGLNYVYLAKYQENEDAYAAYRSKMKGAYQEDIWIMHVENPRYSNWADTIYQDNE